MADRKPFECLATLLPLAAVLFLSFALAAANNKDTNYLKWTASSKSPKEPNIAGKWVADNSTGSTQYLFDFLETDQSYQFIVTAAGWSLDWATGKCYVDGGTGEVKIEADNGETLHGGIDTNSMSITWHSPNPNITYPSWVKIPDIDKVHVVFMNHLDVGYNGISPQTGYINNVMNVYFGSYFPRAAQFANYVPKEFHGDSFVYTTHPWLLSLYFDCPENLVLSGVQLKCPSEANKNLVANAIRNGGIVWHAGAMNMQYDLMDKHSLLASLYLAESLATRFNVSSSCSISLRDVPGLPSAMLGIAEDYFSGLCSYRPLISVGVNGGTSPPSPPASIFAWTNAGQSGGSSLGTWHPGGYPSNPGFDVGIPGGLSYKDIAVIPEAKMALAFAFRTDNSGPPKSMAEIHDNLEIVRNLFPSAEVAASSFDEFSRSLQAVWKPTATTSRDIGDTWIQGVASDPRKMAEFRALRGAYTDCINRTVCSGKDPKILNATRFMIKLAEHTWGLPSVRDTYNWDNVNFDKVMNQSNFVACVNSWKEQREYKDLFLNSLEQTSLLAELSQIYLSYLQPPSQDSLYDYDKIDARKQIVICHNCDDPLTVLFDYNTGGFADLHSTNTTWADSMHKFPVVSYHTYNETDFERFSNTYDFHGNSGFDKPNSTASAKPDSKTWLPSKVEFYKGKWADDNYLAVLYFDSHLTTNYGAPQQVWFNYTFTSLTYKIELGVTWFYKRPTRLAEATMLKFTPLAKNKDMHCTFSQFGQDLSIVNVMQNGSVYQRAGDGFECKFTGPTCPASVKVTSRDVPLLCPIFESEEPTPFPYPFQPNKQYVQAGMGFNLHNNIWNTNYPLWYPFVEGEGDENFYSYYEITLGSEC